MSEDLIWLSAAELSRLYRNREVSPVEVVNAVYERLEQVDPLINAMVTVTEESAREAASEAEKRFAQGETLPALYGIPLTVKDLSETAGVRTTYGIATHKDYVPDFDSLSWARLKREGVILIGKTTTPENGGLGITESYLTGSTSTPWDVSRASGGSSGGAAAAVVSGIAPIAWGSDGGGSIRVPSSLCGAVGIKPTAGRIPHLNGDDADSTDGPITRSVMDAAMLLDVTVGPHPLDRTALPRTADNYVRAATVSADLTGVRVAACVDFKASPLEPEVRRVFMNTLDEMRAAGAIVEEVVLDLPDPTDFYLHYWGPASATYFQKTFDEGGPIWPRVIDIAERGSLVTMPEASRAMREGKTALYNVYRRVFENFDVIVCPTTPIASFTHNDDLGGVRIVDGRKTGVYLHSLTESPAHAGIPAINMRCGFTAEGLPVGMQILAPLYEDMRAVSFAARYEAVTQWHLVRPQF